MEPTIPQLSVENIEVMKQIGEGASAEVFLAKQNTQDKLIALKVFPNTTNQDNEEGADLFQSEALLQSKFNHPSIIKVVGIVTDTKISAPEESNAISQVEHGIAVEYAPYGDLLGLLLAAGALPAVVARTYTCQLISALDCLQKARVAHCDLKLQNIFVDDEMCLKLGDFGLAVEVPNGMGVQGLRGSAHYIAPESRASENGLACYDPFKSDLFSFGVIIFELSTGQSPFNSTDPTQDELFNLVAREEWELFWEEQEILLSTHRKCYSFVKCFKELMEGLLTANPRQRWSLSEVKKSSWLKGSVVPDQKIKSWIDELLKKQDSDFYSKFPIC